MMTMKGGTSPACAACKYQRRKCSSDCILAPYFPATQSKAFQNAHRLFGVSNIMKILKQLNTLEQKEEAMLSIKYESDARERDPVHGCTGIIIDLRKQIRQTIHELHCVYSQLAFYREQNVNNGGEMDPAQLQLAIQNNPLGFQHHSAMGTDYPAGYETESADALAFQHFPAGLDSCYASAEGYYDPMNPMRSNNPVLNHVQVAADDVHHQLQAFVNPDVRPLPDYENMELNVVVNDDLDVNVMVDDRQSFVETKEASESSSKSTLQDYPEPVERVSERELRNAAACLSLTSNNKGGVEIF